MFLAHGARYSYKCPAFGSSFPGRQESMLFPDSVTAVIGVALKIAPRLAFRMHAEDENLGASLASTCTVQRFEGNVTNRPE